MADGMQTRYRAHEESISSIMQEMSDHAERISTLSTSNAQLQQTCGEMQQSISEIRQVLIRIERQTLPSTNLPLLPTPSPLSNSSVTPPNPQTLALLTAPSNTAQNPTSIRLPKLELPFFTGENVLGWLFQIERFFLFHGTPSHQKLMVATFYMSGTALQWYQWMHATRQLTTWEDFSKALELRFGPSSYLNPEAALYKLRQETTVTAYMMEFESLSTRTHGLSTTNLPNFFISGLKDDIRRELLLLKPTNLPDAIGMAKLVEEKLEACRPTWSRPTGSRLLDNPATVTVKSPLSPLPIKKLTPTEMAARRE